MDEIISYDPRTGAEVGRVAATPPEAVHEAAARARKAFVDWADQSHSARAGHLKELKRVLVANADRIAETVAAETGKHPDDALITEVAVAGAITDYLRRRAGHLLQPDRRSALPFLGAKAWVEYHPRGVAGVIAPWNYPFSLPFGPTLNALAAGCTVVLKPSEVTPLSGALVGELIEEAGFPAGVVQVCQGAAETGAAVVEAADVVSFTGSPGVARKVAAKAAEDLTPVIMELGGKDAMLVLDDADLTRAARAAVWGGLVNAGQTCISVERVYVVDGVYDRFLGELRNALRPVNAGSGDNADIGPIIHGPQLDVVQRHVDDAVARGATVLAGGARKGGPGRFFEPTLLVDVDHTMEVMKEETFGPVLAVMRVPDEETAVELANDSKYGLHGSVWTGDAGRGRRVASAMDTGTVAINNCLVNYGMSDLPFGGIGESGYGSNNGPEGLRAFCYPKAVSQARLKLSRELWWYPRPGGRRLWKLFTRAATRR